MCAVGATQKIEIPVHIERMPIDQVAVAERSSWFPEMQKEVQRAYRFAEGAGGL